MRIAFGNVYLQMIFVIEYLPKPFSKGRRMGINICNNIEYFTRNHADQFCLGLSQLIMQSSHDVLMRAGNIVLYKYFLNTIFFISSLIETFIEKTSIVCKNLWLNQQDARQEYFFDLHF